MTARPVPEGFHTLTPHLIIKDCAKAVEWYKAAFGVEEVFSNVLPDGQVMHARLKVGDCHFMANDEFPDMGVLGPASGARSPVTLHLYVEDVDAVFNRAVEAGATVTMPVQDMFWGDRYGCITDPFGHCWSIATSIEEVKPEEILRRAQKHFAEGMGGEA